MPDVRDSKILNGAKFIFMNTSKEHIELARKTNNTKITSENKVQHTHCLTQFPCKAVGTFTFDLLSEIFSTIRRSPSVQTRSFIVFAVPNAFFAWKQKKVIESKYNQNWPNMTVVLKETGMCLWSTDAPGRQQSQTIAKISYILTPPNPSGMWCQWSVRNL